jgi:hypothetical protein
VCDGVCVFVCVKLVRGNGLCWEDKSVYKLTQSERENYVQNILSRSDAKQTQTQSRQ